MVIALLSISSAFVVSFLLTRYLLQPHAFLNIMDHPNERSLHSQPIPCTGGVSIFIAIILGFSIFVAFSELFVMIRGLLFISVGAIIIMFISFLDDRYKLSVLVRFTVHFTAAGLIIFGGLVPEILTLPLVSFNWHFVVASIFTLLFIVWMTNLFNFMDGMDGFAAGMTIFGFTTLSITGFLQGEILFSILSAIIVSSNAGFLVFNFPPARIFMGDTGSSTLGFLAAVMLLWADKSQIMPLWLGLLLFSPFIVDATVTLIRRVLLREKFWLPHKAHFYQRLVELGWGHRRTVLTEYVIMLITSISVIFIMLFPHGLIGVTVLAGWGIFYISMVFIFHKIEYKKATSNGNN